VLPIAHAGHWALWLLYAVPVLIVLGSIVQAAMRQRRERDGQSPPPPRSE